MTWGWENNNFIFYVPLNSSKLLYQRSLVTNTWTHLCTSTHKKLSENIMLTPSGCLQFVQTSRPKFILTGPTLLGSFVLFHKLIWKSDAPSEGQWFPTRKTHWALQWCPLFRCACLHNAKPINLRTDSWKANSLGWTDIIFANGSNNKNYFLEIK